MMGITAHRDLPTLQTRVVKHSPAHRGVGPPRHGCGFINSQVILTHSQVGEAVLDLDVPGATWGGGVGDGKWVGRTTRV